MEKRLINHQNLGRDCQTNLSRFAGCWFTLCIPLHWIPHHRYPERTDINALHTAIADTDSWWSHGISSTPLKNKHKTPSRIHVSKWRFPWLLPQGPIVGYPQCLPLYKKYIKQRQFVYMYKTVHKDVCLDTPPRHLNNIKYMIIYGGKSTPKSVEFPGKPFSSWPRRSRPLLSCHHGHIPRLIAVAAGHILRVLPGDWRSNRRQVVSTRNLVDSIYIYTQFGYWT